MSENIISDNALAALRERVGLPASYTERSAAVDREFAERPSGSLGSVFVAGIIDVDEHVGVSVEATVYSLPDNTDWVELSLRWLDIDIDSEPKPSFAEALEALESKLALARS